MQEDERSAAAMTELGRLAERRGAADQAWRWWRAAAFDGDEPAMRHLARTLRHEHADEAQLWRWHAVMAGKQRAAAGPPPRAVVAAAADLGALRLTFGHGDRAPAEAAVGCGLLVALGIAAAGLVAALSGAVVVAVTVLAVAAAALIALGVAWGRAGGRRYPGVWEHEHGVVVRDGAGAVTGAPWPGVTITGIPGGHRISHPGGVLETAPESFPPGEEQVLAHRIAHWTDHGAARPAAPGREPADGVS